MRLLLLALNILISVSLSINAPELAAATSAKPSKSKGQKLYRAHFNKKSPTNPGDVWERIRLGMKIPHPIAMQVQASEKNNSLNIDGLSLGLAAASGTPSASMKMREAPSGIDSVAESHLKVLPHKLSAPTNNYTELGRLRLGSKSPAIVSCKQPTPAKLRQEYALRNKAKMAQLNEQIKASMEFHPELRRRTVIMGSMGQPSNNALPTSLSERAQIGHLAKTAIAGKPCLSSSEQNITTVGTDIKREKNRPISLEKQLVKTERGNSKQAMIDERINQHIAAYTQNPGFLRRVAERAHPYLYHIVEGLSKNRMPLELALLPIVESAYQPTAQSPKSAAGLWQFIPSTGRDFNLDQSNEYDERLDIPQSTQAAIRFLNGLKDHFKGDWLLALAAYNSGQGTVDHAISRNQAEGLATDFWSLQLPEETKNYVPRLLALSSIFAHPASYGIKLPPVRNEPYFVKVKIDRKFDINYLADKEISTVAKLADLSYEQFTRLNPGYLSNTLSSNGPYNFLMPVANANQLHERLASIAKFMAEPTEPVKSVVLKEKTAAIDLSHSRLSLISELVSKKATEATKLSTPFLSLNVDGNQTRLVEDEQPLA